MAISRAQLKLTITEDLLFRAPLWALIILTIWGAITFVMFWVLINVVKPSIDKRIQDKNSTSVSITQDR
ncbi:MAG: hypothetical protein HYU69_12545 [Bacteroidetes bacterium]|nr:hypothetical protein [Bacteroidota bacterium]